MRCAVRGCKHPAIALAIKNMVILLLIHAKTMLRAARESDHLIPRWIG